MKATGFKQLTLPPLALSSDMRVNAILTAADKALRVVIKNKSAASCFFGEASESMIGPDAPGADVFEIEPDDEEIYVLAPQQKLYGCANAIGATVDVTWSEMVPLL